METYFEQAFDGEGFRRSLEDRAQSAISREAFRALYDDRIDVIHTPIYDKNGKQIGFEESYR